MEKLSYKSLFTILVVLLIGIVGLLRLQGKPSKVQASWYNTNWSKRLMLTIDHTKVTADQTDFPVLISLSSLPADFHSYINQTDARDIRVTKDDGTTELPREIVYYDSATDAGELYFKYSGVLSSTTDTNIFIYYGNPSVSDYSASDTFGKNNVWDSNYVGVWHLNEVGSTRFDSTSNNNHLAVSGTVGYSTSGKVGTAADFTQAGNLFRTDANLSTNFPSKNGQTTTDLSVSYWLRPDTLSYLDWLGKESNDGWYFYDGTNNMALSYYSGSEVNIFSSASSVTTGNWNYIVGVHNNTADTDTIYINGTSSGNATGRTGNPDASDASFRLGGTDSWPTEANGLIDEVRVSITPRSATWVSTEHNNQNSPSTFFLSEILTETGQVKPVLHYKFDERTGTSANDSSGRSNTGTLGSGTSAPTWADGKYEAGLNFDGSNDYIVTADSPSLSITGDLTISAWIKPTAITAATTFSIAGKWEGANNDYLLTQYGDEIRMYVGSSSNYATTNSANLVVGTYYLASAIYDASAQTVTIYLNGIPQSTTVTGTIPSSISDTNSSFYTGAYVASSGSTINAQVSANNQDAQENTNNTSFTITPLDNKLHLQVHQFDSAMIGANFSNITVPQGATITNAYAEFNVLSTSQDDCYFVQYANDVDNSNDFTTEADIYSRAATSATVTVTDDAVGTGWYGSGNDISAVIQEVVDRPGWSSGNAMTIIWGPLSYATYGVKECWSSDYNGSSANAPKLHIEYAGTGAIQSPYSGTIDNLQVYDYARSAAEIKTDFNNSSGVSQGTSTASSLIDGLIGYWTLNEIASPALDKSGIGYSGAWTNSPSSISGKFGKAISLNGTNQYVSMGDQSLYDLSLPFSLSAWIYMDQLPSTKGTDSEVISKYAAAPNRQWTLAIGTDDALYFWKSHNGTNGQYSTDYTFTSGDVGRWIHVGFTADSSGVTRLFVDGEVVSTGQFTDLTMYNGGTASLLIGARSNPANYFDGKIDEVRIYNKTLSPSQLKSLYQYAPNPIGHWKMEETSWNNNCSTNTAMDSSGADHHLRSCPASTGPTGGSVGKIGRAGTFDGSNDYLESTSTDFNLTGDITLSAWVKPMGTPAGDAYIIDRTNNSNGYSLGWQSTRRPRLRVGNGSSYVELTAANALNLNTWYHLSATITSTGVAKIYVNGQLDIGGTGMVVLASTGQNLRVGSRATVNTVNAQIDEVKIYDYVRSQSQIAQDIGGNTSLSSPLIHLKFDEGSGDTANDSSTSNKDGDLGDSTVCPGASSTCPGWSNLGKFGKAISFDSLDDRLFTPLITSNNDNISFSNWVYWNGGDSSNQTIYYNGATSSNGWSFFVDGSNNLTIVCENNDTVTSTAQLTPGTWQHLVTQRVNGTWEMYVNAKKVTLGGGISCAPSTPTTRSTIGSIISQNYAFNGLIDEFKAYDFTLNQEQINSLYNSGFSLQSGQNTQTIGSTTTSLQYCVLGDTSPCNPPIGEWKFNENSGTPGTILDTSGNNNIGTANGGMTSSDWVPGKVGSALKFDGTNDYINAYSANLASLFSGNIGTFTSWFKFDDGVWADGAQRTVLTFGADINNQITFRKASDGTLGSLYTAAANSKGSMDCAPNDYGYIFMAMSWDQTAGRVVHYCNGVLTDTDTALGTWTGALSSTRATIGTHTTGNSYPWKGVIDEIKLYNYVRTPSQVALDYNRGGPVAWWKFDENTGTTAKDSSGNGLHASMTNMSLSSWVSGKYNYGLDFLSSDTDNRVSITDAASSDLLDFDTNSFAISLWIKTSSSTFSYILEKRIAASGSGGYGINLDTAGKVRFGIDENDTSFPGNSVTSNKAINDNTWHHVVMTKNGITNINVYIDGVLDNTASVSVSADGTLSNSTTFVIGAESDGTSSEFTGQIDDVRVYNYLPTSTQIKNIMNNGSINFR